jgi:hypothetical protein
MTTPVIEQTTGLDRDPIDKYYTKPSVAQDCVDLMKTHVSPRKLRDMFIEPSAGNGSFLIPLKSIKCAVRMYDIRPDHPQVVERDYLTIPVEEMTNGRAPDGRIHVVGNPPFGRQASLAIKFIKKTCTFADSISFILPKSFKKDSMRRAFSSNFHLVHQSDLNTSSFLVNNKDHDSPCVFQVWVRRSEPRPEPVIHTPENFFFVKRPDLCAPVEGKLPVIPHAAVRRVGVYAGKAIRTMTAEDAQAKSDQTHYFIRFVPETCAGRDIDNIVEHIGGITYATDNTVGPRSISKNELIGAINDRLKTTKQEDSKSCDCPIL